MMLRSIATAVVVAAMTGVPVQGAERIYAHADGDGTLSLSDDPHPGHGWALIVGPEHDEAAPAALPSGAARPPSPAVLAAVEKEAREASVDPALVYAVMAVESGYNPRAISPKGAQGLMQLMPQTALRYGVSDRLDIAQNIHAGVWHLRALLDRFDGDLSRTIAAYNAGEAATVRAAPGMLPPFAETQAYVPRVLAVYARLRSASAMTPTQQRTRHVRSTP